MLIRVEKDGCRKVYGTAETENGKVGGAPFALY